MPNPTPTTTLTLERTFDATPEELWAAWTDPAQYAKWLNPAAGFDLVIHEFDVREGGRVRFDMPQPDGNPNPQEGVFHELDPPRRLVTGDADRSFLMEVTFEPQGARTRMVIQVTGLPADFHAPATEGWNRSLDHLAAMLAGARGGPAAEDEIVLSRVFDAPRARVFDAYTDPEQLAAWYGPDGFRITIHAIDVRPGGVWRFTMHGPDGTDYPNRITYEEVARPERLAFHHGTDEEPEKFRVTVTFDEVEGGRTRLTSRMRFPTKEARDHVVREVRAIELGNQTLGRLAAHLAQAGKEPPVRPGRPGP